MPTIKPNDRFDREDLEREQAWRTLREIPEYQEDYNASLSLRLETDAKAIKTLESKWGFYPLADYRQKHGSFEFATAFASYSDDVDRFKSAVDFNGLDMFSRDEKGRFLDPNDNICEEPAPDPILDVKIDLSRSNAAIWQDLKDSLTHIRTILKIKPKQDVTHDHLKYLVSLLIDQGFTDSEIQERLTPKTIWSLAYDDGARKSYREKIQNKIKEKRKTV